MRATLGQAVRLRGRVRSDESIVLARATLKVRGAPKETRVMARPFALVLQDDSVVQVDAKSIRAEDVFAPERRLQGPFAEIAKSPLALAFSGHGPGPHVKAHVTGAVIESGGEVELVGVVSALGQQVEGTYREAVPLVVREVTASHIASGKDAASAIDRALLRVSDRRREIATRPKLPRKSHIVAILIALAISALAIKMIGAVPWLIAEWLAAIGFLAVFGQRVDKTELFTTREWHPFEILALVGALACAIAMAVDHAQALFAGWPFASKPASGAVRLVPLGFALAAWLELAGFVLGSSLAARVVAVMRAARPFGTESKNGSWGAVIGTVEDPTPVRVSGEAAALSRVRKDDRIDVVLDDSFVLATDTGAVTVDPKDAIWTSTARRNVNVGAMGVVIEEIPVRAQALVVGRIAETEEGPRVASTGPESLFVFAVTSGHDPRQELEHWEVGRRRALVVELSLCVAVSVIAAVALWLA